MEDHEKLKCFNKEHLLERRSNDDQDNEKYIDVKTGQKTCYDASGNVINCPDTGQDGDIQPSRLG